MEPEELLVRILFLLSNEQRKCLPHLARFRLVWRCWKYRSTSVIEKYVFFVCVDFKKKKSTQGIHRRPSAFHFDLVSSIDCNSVDWLW